MIEPCGHRVIVRADEVETTTASGIVILSETQKEMERAGTQRGVVVAIGPTAWKAFDRLTVRQKNGEDHIVGGLPWAEVGDYVFYSRYGGTLVEDDDAQSYTILNDEDVVGILRKGDK